ncbi:MAG: hypothetical protein U5N86_12245 [Planctomycetota bacterium]|nr:hypothetical protein [Planctomycetota bacterium]
MSENDSENIRTVNGFLSRCALVIRLRRTLNAVFVLSAATGLSALVMKLVGVGFSTAGDPLFWSLLSVVCASAAVWPIRMSDVAREVDERLASRSLFSAVTSLGEKDSRYAPVIFEDAAKAAGCSSSLGAVKVVQTRLLPLALLGVILGLLAVIAPDGPAQTRGQILAQLLERYRVEVVQGSTQTEGEQLPDEVRKIIEEQFAQIARKVEEGDIKSAVKQINEAANRVDEASQDTDTAVKRLEEAGFSPNVAQQLANGTFSGTLSAEELERAADAVSGARAASLAKAADRVASGEDVAQAIEAAMREARRLSRLENLKDRLRAMLVEYGNELFSQLTVEQQKEVMALLDDEMAGGTTEEKIQAGEAVRIRQDMLQQVSKARYPLKYRLALFDYYSPED